MFVQGPGCNPAGQELFCKLGALRKGKSVTVLAVYQTPASGSTFDVAFEANTGGASDSDGGSSHGDVLTTTGSTALIADTKDFLGKFATTKARCRQQPDAQQQQPADHAGQAAGGQHRGDGAGRAGRDRDLSVRHRDVQLDHLPSPPDPPPAAGCFGQISEIHVNRGAVYPTGFAVVIQWDSTLNPPNASDIDIWHEFDSPKAGGITGEDITANCQFQGNAAVPKNVPCLQRSNLSGGDRQVIVWLKENGKTFGH